MTPPALILTVVPFLTKFVPVIVTVTVVPLKAFEGEIDEIVGMGTPIVNVIGLLVPREFVTVTSREPGTAFASTASVMVTEVLDIEMLLKVTPRPLISTVDVPAAHEPPPPPTIRFEPDN